MSTELSERFISAFCRLEDELRRLTGSLNRESFSCMLDHVARSNAAFAHYRDDLKEYAELRNAIVHKRIGDRPIAEPHPDTVAHIESIAAIVTSAPRLGDHFRKQVEICSPQDAIKQILSLFLKRKFNQLPVYNGEKLAGLVTSDSIALWLADSFQKGDRIDPEATVQTLLLYGSSKDDYVVLSGTNSIFDAIESFDSAQKRGKHLKAIIITENGSSNQHPIGIITTIEVPGLIKMVNPEPESPFRHRH
jgi:CBS domain-containing protein